MQQTRYPSEKEKQLIDKLLKRVTKLNLGYSIGYIIGGIGFAFGGFAFFVKGGGTIWEYLIGSILAIIGILVLFGSVLSLFRKNESKLGYSDIFTIEGQLQVVVKHSPKSGTSYRFYMNDSLLYLPNKVWTGIFINLDKKHLKLDVYPVPYSSSSVANAGETEYLVVGVFNYNEAGDVSSELYSSKMGLNFVPVGMLLIIVITFWNILGSSIGPIVKGEYLSKYLSGFYTFLPLALSILLHLLAIFLFMRFLKIAERQKRASVIIQKELEHEIHSNIVI